MRRAKSRHGRWAVVCACVASAAGGARAWGQDFWWGGGSGATWGTTSFFTDQTGSTNRNALPGTTNTVVFATTGASNLATTLGGTSRSVLGLRTASDFALAASLTSTAGEVLTVGTGGVTVGGTGSLTVLTPLLTSASNYLTDATVAAGTLTLSGALTTAGAGLVKTGPGLLVLGAGNTYGGVTTISGGTLRIGNGGTAGSVTGNIANSAALVFDRSNDFTYGGVISGAGTLTIAGTGTATFTAQHTMSGLTRVNAGTLSLGDGGTSGRLQGDAVVASGAMLVFNRSNAPVFNGVISGAGTVVQAGSGTLTFTGANLHTGPTRVDAGTLRLGNGGTTGSVTSAVTVSAGGTLALVRSDDYTFAPDVVGAGTVVQAGSGTVTFAANYGYTGPTRVDAGTLRLGTGESTGLVAGDVAVAAGGMLVFDRTDSYTYPNAISGTGTVVKSGNAILRLSGANTHTGPTLVTAGTLGVGALGTTGSISSNVTVSAGALLRFSRSNDLVYPGDLDGLGDLEKEGAGTLTFTGLNTLTGFTRVSQGLLQLGSNSVNGRLRGEADVLSGAALAFNRSSNLTHSWVIAGPGEVWQTGTGTTTFTANHVYGGLTRVNRGNLRIGDNGTTGWISGNVVLNGGKNTALTFARSDDMTFPGVISGVGDVVKAGGGSTLTFTGNSTAIGTVTVLNGALRVGAGGTQGSVAADIETHATVVFNRSGTWTYGGDVSGTGEVVYAGPGTGTFSGLLTHTGGTRVTGGRMQVTQALTGSNDLTVSQGTLDLWTPAHSVGNVTLGNSTTEPTGLELAGTGPVTVRGTVTFAGLTSLAPTVGAMVSAPLVFPAGQTLVTRTGGRAFSLSMLFAGALSGPGGVRIDASGTSMGGQDFEVHFAASNTYAGVTRINGATLLVSVPGALPATTALSLESAASRLYLSENGLFGPQDPPAPLYPQTVASLSGAAGSVYLDATTLTVNQASNTTFGGTIEAEPGGGLIKNGAGVLTLTGDAGAARSLTVNAGEVRFGNGGAAVPAPATIAGTATVTFDLAGSYTYAGSIGGSDMRLVKVGAGTVTLTGSNTVLDSAQIGQGRLRVGDGGAAGTLAGDVFVESGAVLELSRSVNVSSGWLISGPGAVEHTGVGTTTFTITQEHTGPTRVEAGTVVLGNGGTSGGLPSSAVTVAAAGTLTWNRSDAITHAPPITGAGTLAQSGAGTVTLTGANTHTGPTRVTAGTLRAGNGGTTGTVSPSVTVSAGGMLVFDRSDAVTYAGVVTGAGTVAQSGSGTLTFTGEHTLTGPTRVNAGTLRLGDGGTSGSVAGNVINATRLELARSDAWTLPGVISGAGTLVHTGTGTTTLSADSTLTGPTRVDAGTLRLGDNGTSGSVAGLVTVSASGTLAFNRSDALVYASVISGAGTVAQLGSGTTTFTGNQAYTGPTRVEAGTLRVGNGGTTGSLGGGITVSAGGTLVFERSNTLVVAGLIDGPGTVVQSGTGTTTFTGGNTNTGPTRVDAGTLQLGNGGATGRIQGDAVIAAGAALVINRNANFTYSDIISGAGTVSQVGTATTTFTGASTYTGPTRITAGTLRLGNGGTSGSIASDVTVSAGGSLAFNRSDLLTYAGLVSGTGTVVHSGGGTTTFTATSPLTGPLLVNAGTVRWGDGGTEGRFQGDVTIAAAGALVFNRSSNLTVSSVISGAGTLVQATSAQTTLAGANTHTGPTRIDAGTIRIGTGGTTASISGPVTVAATASLVFNRSGTLTYGGVIAGVGTVAQSGTGTVTLTGGRVAGGALTVTAGTLKVAPAGGAMPSGVLDTLRAATTVDAGTRLEVLTRIDSAALTVLGTAGQAGVVAIGPTSHTADAVSVLTSLSIAGDGAPLGSRVSFGRLTIDQRLVVRDGALAEVADLAREYLASAGARGLGGWATDLTVPSVPVSIPFTQLAVVQNIEGGVARFTVFGDPVNGPTVGVTDVLVMPTWTGDANLDGLLDARDFNAILNGWGNGLGGWANGDNDYDGVVDGADFSRFLAAYSYYQTSGFPLGGGESGGSSIPEPGSLALLALIAAPLARRRRATVQLRDTCDRGYVGAESMAERR